MNNSYVLIFTVYPIIKNSETDEGPYCQDVNQIRIKTILYNIFSYYFSNLRIIQESCSGYVLTGTINVKEHDINPSGNLVDYFDGFMNNDIIEAGPDTWMEGNISISLSDILESSRNKKYIERLYADNNYNNYYEMFIGIKVNKVFSLASLIRLIL